VSAAFIYEQMKSLIVLIGNSNLSFVAR